METPGGGVMALVRLAELVLDRLSPRWMTL
jgi:hypothetical protein